MNKRKIKRIDCVGNANNHVLLIALALRKLGYDAHLHLTMGDCRDHPEALYPEWINGYPEWIHDWRTNKQWLYLRFNPNAMDRIAFALRHTDALLLNFDAIALGAILAKPTVCLLTGTDLHNFSNPNDMAFGDWRKDKNLILHMLMQRAAIRNACAYTIGPEGLFQKTDALLRGIGVKSNRRISFLISDTDSLAYTHQPMREKMQILYAARLSWDIGKGDCTEFDDKGTDLFVRGFSRFIHSGGEANLTMFCCGAREVETKALALALGIDRYITWLPHTTQASFNLMMKESDLIIDQTGRSHIGMAAADAMSLGRPVLATASNHNLWGIEEEFPLCHAATEDEICNWLHRLTTDYSLRESIGKRSRKFSEEYFSTKSAAKKIIKALMTEDMCYDENIILQALKNAICKH